MGYPPGRGWVFVGPKKDGVSLGGGNSNDIFGIFIPIFGETIQFYEHIFQMGWFNHQLVNNACDVFVFLLVRGNRRQVLVGDR